ncbi:MAG: carboxymuconolactone decarboxylase family protein, partial [Bacteroidales bacterium]
MKKKIAKHYEIVKKYHPEYMKAVENLGMVAKQAGPLDGKQAQLIQLAASIACRSEGAVHSHTQRALEEGATPEEIRHCVL